MSAVVFFFCFFLRLGFQYNSNVERAQAERGPGDRARQRGVVAVDPASVSVPGGVARSIFFARTLIARVIPGE